MRTFDSGATRDNDEDKPDYEGYLSPLVIERYGRYMTKHRRQADGTVRASDNWQKGIPQDVYLKSLFRHLVDVWTMHRSHDPSKDALEDALCAILFNAMGYLFEMVRPASQAASQLGGASNTGTTIRFSEGWKNTLPNHTYAP